MKKQFKVYSFLITIFFVATFRIPAQIVDAKFEHIPIGIAFCFLQDSNGFYGSAHRRALPDMIATI